MEDKPLLVEDALKPARYRVYPDTPLAEVVDLMVRREVRAVPVVGELYEVLGIITSGDALDRVLKEWPDAPDREQLLARDVMTRAVLCVSEDQPLVLRHAEHGTGCSRPMNMPKPSVQFDLAIVWPQLYPV